MIKKTLSLLFFTSCLFLSHAQEENKHYIVKNEKDTLCSHYYEFIVVDFDVSQKSGCEFIITQLLNKTTYLLEDSLSYIWKVFNDDASLYLIFTEEDPDVFLYYPGNYHIALIATNKQGCSDTLVKHNVIVLDKIPHIDFTFSPENALFAEYFGEVEFTNLTDPKLLNDSTVQWYWDMGDSVTNMNARSPLHLFSMWGDYHTTFHLKTKNGCKVALTKTVTIEADLFFPDTLRKLFSTTPDIFAINNLNTHIPQNDPDQFRTNHLFVYNDMGKMVYEQKNYDSYIKNNVIVEGVHSLSVTILDAGVYFYSFYYKGKNKRVHYNGVFWVI
ncbi:MAG: gliding motility-associated C-terminal domain-containing protein [Lentimicrobiaceae bacterium]|nr:gliding motility-associated C-terminal domain-containing protein [Lentimicrobiaceae bacterium]